MSTLAGRIARAERDARALAERQVQTAARRAHIQALPGIGLHIVSQVGPSDSFAADGMTELAVTVDGKTTTYRLNASMAWHLGAQLCGLEAR